MKKLLFTFIILLSVIIAPSVVLADNTDKPPLEPVPFTFITSEKDDFQPENEYSITFAKMITINAESIKGAKVFVTVSFDESLEEPPEVYDEVVIGASLKFIQPVALKLGDNAIQIAVEKEGFETTRIDVIVKRKDGTIMESLQNLIVIPGLNK